MLDFRFLLGAVVVFVLTVMAGLRIFGATEPLLATMGDQPRVEAVALPRHAPTPLPNVPRAMRPDRPFVRPAVIDVPRPAAAHIAETIPREPPALDVTGSVEPVETHAAEPVPTQAAEPATTDAIEPAQTNVAEPAETQPADPAPINSAEPAETQSADPAPAQAIKDPPLPQPRPLVRERTKEETTGSIARARTEAPDDAPKARPKRRPVVQPKKEPENANPFSLFFPFKQQAK